MVIPEVNADQITIMNEAILSMPVFAQMMPLHGDPMPDAAYLTKANADVDGLLAMGFLENISEAHTLQLNELIEKSKHTWRILRITALGRAMFQCYTSPSLN